MVLHMGKCSPSFMFLNVFGLFHKKKLKGLSRGKSPVRPISEPKRGQKRDIFSPPPPPQGLKVEVSHCSSWRRISFFRPLEGIGVQTMSERGQGAELQGVRSKVTVTFL